MSRARLTGITGSAALVAAILVAVVLFRGGDQPAEAQFRDITSRLVDFEFDESLVYTSRFVNEVVPGRRDDAIRKVYPFPHSSCFLVRTTDAITVWARYERGLRRLLEIKLDDRLEEIHFLDDGRTFILHMNKSARVYSLDRQFVEVEERRTIRR